MSALRSGMSSDDGGTRGLIIHKYKQDLSECWGLGVSVPFENRHKYSYHPPSICVLQRYRWPEVHAKLYFDLCTNYKDINLSVGSACVLRTIPRLSLPIAVS